MAINLTIFFLSCLVLGAAYFLTNAEEVNGNLTPSTNGTNGWNICHTSEGLLGTDFTIRCAKDQTPHTRHFSILTSVGRISICEVAIYGQGKFFIICYKCNIFNNIKLVFNIFITGSQLAISDQDPQFT